MSPVGRTARSSTMSVTSSDPGTGLITGPIKIEDRAWVEAFACIGPEVTIGTEAIVTMGSVLMDDAGKSETRTS